MVVILNAVLIDDLPAVEAACAEALAGGVSRSDVGLNLLALKRCRPQPTGADWIRRKAQFRSKKTKARLLCVA